LNRGNAEIIERSLFFQHLDLWGNGFCLPKIIIRNSLFQISHFGFHPRIFGNQMALLSQMSPVDSRNLLHFAGEKALI
jgi:hypothetical protein